MNKLAILIASALLALSSVNATTIAWWDFSVLAGGHTFTEPEDEHLRTEHGPDGLPPNTLAPGVTNPGGLQRGSSDTNHIGNPRRGGSWGGVNFRDGSYDIAVANGRYYEFTLNFDPDTIIKLTMLEGYFYTSSTGPNLAQWAYSINDDPNFYKIGGAVELVDNGSAYYKILLDDINTKANWEEYNSITFRVVAWGGTGTSGSFYFDGRNKTNGIPGLALYGVIPEPSVALLFGIGIVFIACRRKKR